MALPTVFTIGDVFTAANANLLRSNQYNKTTSTKTVSYVLVAADVGTRVLMNAAGSTTITVNTSLFYAGDTLEISNIGAGVCTITSGTCTVTSSAPLALVQYTSGTLFFTSASAAIFIASAGSGGKIAQVILGSTSTQVTSTSSSLTDTGLTATITPTLNTSKVLVMVVQNGCSKAASSNAAAVLLVLLRGATAIATGHGSGSFSGAQFTNSTTVLTGGSQSINWLDTPATTSATTYKTQFKPNTSPESVAVQSNQLDTSLNMSSIILMEVLA